MIEPPPAIEPRALLRAMLTPPDDETEQLVNKANEKYEYWDTVKYRKCPEGCTPHDLWIHVKSARVKNLLRIWEPYGIILCLTNKMQRMCHEFDMNFGGTWGTDAIISDNYREQYLASSLMEEAIYSSMMEGASTTRRKAKEMLRSKMTPKDKSQQKIVNNYQTIRHITGNKQQPLTPESLLQVHRLMTERTLQDPEDAGRFRTNDNVVVEDGITHETVHTPPPCGEIPAFVEALCTFFNEKDQKIFIHPIIRGIIIHFMLAYVHPFADGNGRTARALFYWYMLKEGYWLTEYLSISRVIAHSKKAYEKAYQYVEADNKDLGYFVAYNLKVLEQSFRQLQDYIRRKQNEQKAAGDYLRIGGINERQAQIIKMFADDPKAVITVKALQGKFLVSPTTAKADLIPLVERGLLSEIPLNKVKRGYVKGEEFDRTVNGRP